MEIYFMRHAETVYNKKGIWAGRVDCELTEEGLEKTKELGENLDMTFDEVYCSPLTRTKQTVKALLPNVTPIVDERIIEVSIGEWEDTSKDLYPKELRDKLLKGEYTPPGAESFECIDKRVSEFILEMFKKYKNNEKILVVTHNGVMRSINRKFFDNEIALMSKNLGILKVDESNLEYYLNNEMIERGRGIFNHLID